MKLLIIILICIVIAYIANYFISKILHKCPKCNSTNTHLFNKEDNNRVCANCKHLFTITF